MPTALSRPARRQQARDRIVEAARAAVAESGWRGAQIALIAHQAGVATGSVYRYFDSKADLYAHVLSRVSEREIAIVAAIVDSGGPAAQRLVDAIFAFTWRAIRGRRLACALIAEPCEPEIDRARLRYRAALAGQLCRLIQQGIDAGEFIAVDPRLAASCVTGAFMEALVGPLTGDDGAGADARARARAIAAVAARMVFRQAAPRLTPVSKRYR
jgi:AcrR family transcriptional regulator